MAGKQKLTGKVICDLLDQYPNAYSLSIAKIAYRDNPLLYNDVEHARCIVRYYRGAIGKKTKSELRETKYLKDYSTNEYNPLGLPDSDEREWLPYYLSNDCKNVLWMSDIHLPYHSIEALTVAINKGLQENVDTIFLGGDTLDFYQLSRWEKDPKKRHFSDEMEMAREFLTKLRQLFPNARIYFKEGNHEERYENYLKAKAPELFSCEEFRLEILLRLGENRIEWIGEKRISYVGKLRLAHGHEFGRSVFSPVNPARGYYMKSKQSMMAGHNHQTSEHTEPNLDGDIETVWSTGCLCELHPEYMPINKWNHGFAIIKVLPNGDYNVNNYRIHKGEIL